MESTKRSNITAKYDENKGYKSQVCNATTMSNHFVLWKRAQEAFLTKHADLNCIVCKGRISHNNFSCLILYLARSDASSFKAELLLLDRGLCSCTVRLHNASLFSWSWFPLSVLIHFSCPNSKCFQWVPVSHNHNIMNIFVCDMHWLA